MDLLLDPEIRDWVLLPLFLIILFAMMLRHQTSILLRSSKEVNANEAQAKSLIMRAQRLRQNNRSISYAAYSARKEYLASDKDPWEAAREDRGCKQVRSEARREAPPGGTGFVFYLLYLRIFY